VTLQKGRQIPYLIQTVRRLSFTLAMARVMGKSACRTYHVPRF
jgi:hypothetical protein